MTNLTPYTPHWRDRLKLTSRGATKTCFYNAHIAVAGAFGSRLAFDTFALRTMVTGPLFWFDDTNRPWTNHDDLALLQWLQHHDILVGLETAQQAVEATAAANPIHPVRDWLDTLVWDTVPRIDRWLTYHLGADDTPATRAIGAAWLISAVARIYRPGAKADHVLILEGHQGIKKSTALRTLAGPQWFTDELADFGSKDAGLQMRGVWIIELAEMDNLLRGRSSSTTKAFLTRSVDRFRPPYGRRLIESPRECVFAGTINQDEYLADETGSRRFWPVRVRHIDLDALEHDREQIWAESVARYRAGDPWWIDDTDLGQEIREQQHDRRETDTWETHVLDWTARQAVPPTTSEILTSCLGKPKHDITDRDAKRVSRILQAHGWKRSGKRISGLSVKVWKQDPST